MTLSPIRVMEYAATLESEQQWKTKVRSLLSIYSLQYVASPLRTLRPLNDI